MALFELHLVNAIHNGIEAYKQDQAKFKALFFGVNDTTLGTWHQELVDNPPHFRTATATGIEQFPMVLVISGEESVDQRFLDNFGTRSGVSGAVSAFFVSESAQVHILSKHPDLTRVLHVLCRAAFEQARQGFLSSGYHDVQYRGSDALSVEERLAAEEMGIYMKRLNFSASSPVNIPLETAAEPSGELRSLDVLVLASDQKSAANVQGGVNHES